MSNSRSTSIGLSEAVGSSKMISSIDAERLGDLDQLALGGGQVPDLGVERQHVFLAERRQQFGSPAVEAGIGDAGALAAEFRQEDVLEHRQVGDEAGFLHHDRDAGSSASRVERSRSGWPR